MNSSIILHHVNILTPNVEDTMIFYQEIMGMQLAGRFYQKDSIDIAFLQSSQLSGDFFIKLMGPPYITWMEEIYNRRGPHMNHITFLVSDLDAWYEKLTKKGVDFLTRPQLFQGTKQAYFHDASGIIAEICEIGDLSLFPKQSSKLKTKSEIYPYLHHVSITCRDTSVEEYFFNNILGMEVAFEHKGEGIIFLADPSLRVETSRFGPMVEVIGPPGLWEREEVLLNKFGPHLDHISFLVEDVDVMYRNLVSRGVQSIIKPMDFGTTRIALFRDLNNVCIEIELPVWEDRLASWRKMQG